MQYDALSKYLIAIQPGLNCRAFRKLLATDAFNEAMEASEPDNAADATLDERIARIKLALAAAQRAMCHASSHVVYYYVEPQGLEAWAKRLSVPIRNLIVRSFYNLYRVV